MAKIDAHGAHQIGPTLFVEKTTRRDRIYYEAWHLRSDGMVQSRIISTRPTEAAELDLYETKHSSGYSNVGRLTGADIDRLRALLVRRGYTIVKER